MADGEVVLAAATRVGQGEFAVLHWLVHRHAGI
jgi:hypothetical protein